MDKERSNRQPPAGTGVPDRPGLAGKHAFSDGSSARTGITLLPEIRGHSVEHRRVIMHAAEHLIAPKTQQPALLPCGV